MIIYPYKNGSESAKALADALGVLQIKKEGSKFKGSSKKLVINWGNSMSTEEVDKCLVLNKPEAVAICIDKLRFFNHVKAINDEGTDRYAEIPVFTTNKGTAQEWCAGGTKIVCRTILNGHSGQGIVIANTPDQVVDAPLYVEYRPKKSEYRVHILHDRVVDVQRKARDHDVPEDRVNWQIRNHQFGFVFVRDIEPEILPRGVLTNALEAVRICGLDFGAVDVIYNEHRNRSTVLEINTAPGLTGTTLDGYKERFEQIGKLFDNIVRGAKRQPARQPARDELIRVWQDMQELAINGNLFRHVPNAAQN